jgi:hypothetical protein
MMNDKLITPRGLMLVMMESDPAHDDDFNKWYDEEHVPERLACPGFLGARRFKAVEGAPRYLCLYDLESVEAVQTAEYKHRTTNPTEWTQRTHGYRLQTIRNVYSEMPGKPEWKTPPQ